MPTEVHDEVVTGVEAEYLDMERGEEAAAAGGHPVELNHVAPKLLLKRIRRARRCKVGLHGVLAA